MTKKEAAFYKLATVRMAINHVLRQRMTKQALGNPFGFVSIPDAVNLYSHGVKPGYKPDPEDKQDAIETWGPKGQGVESIFGNALSIVPYTKPGQALLGGLNGAFRGFVGPGLDGRNWKKEWPAGGYSAGMTPMATGISSVVAPWVARGVYGSGDLGEGYKGTPEYKEWAERRRKTEENSQAMLRKEKAEHTTNTSEP